MTLTIFTSHNPMSKKAYYDIIQPKFLSWEFIEPYTTKEPPFGALGLVVYLRTYSRYIPELKRRESWWETVLRVVEYSLSLYNYKHVSPEIKNPELVKEGQELFDYMFNLKVFPAGRTLWSGGSEVSKKFGDSQFNCSFRVIDSIEAYRDIFHLLLVGAGVGYSVEERYVSQLPLFNKDVELVHEDYSPLPKEAREEDTNVVYKSSTVNIEIGDSRGAWEKALYEFLNALTYKKLIKKIILNYDSVRPQGERLKTFGGRACLTGDTVVYKDRKKSKDYNQITIKDLFDCKNKNGKWTNVASHFNKIKLRSLDESKGVFYRNRLLDVVDNGVCPVYEIETKLGYKIKATANHRFMNDDKEYQHLEDFKVGSLIAVNGIELKIKSCTDCGTGISRRSTRCKPCYDKTQISVNASETTARFRKQNRDYRASITYCEKCHVTNKRFEVHHIDHNPYNNDHSNLLNLCPPCHQQLHAVERAYGDPYKQTYLSFDEIVSIQYIGKERVYDLVMEGPNHNFVANGFVSHNSGPFPLKEMFSNFYYTLQQTVDGRLSSIQASDWSNYIAKAVVVGGSRRSSQLGLGDINDQEFIRAKANLWTDPDKQQYTTTRVMSNNSVMLWKKPTYEKLKEIFHTMKTEGEPGLIHAAAAAKRRPNFKGLNPCAEILLDSSGVCNLTEINVYAFVKGVNNFDYEGFYRAIRLATRIGSRITNTTMWQKDWDDTQKRDRLLGVSLTGQVEAWDALGWGSTTKITVKERIKYAFHKLNYFFNAQSGKVSPPPTPEEFEKYYYFKDTRITNLLKDAKLIARAEADSYHEEMGIPKSLLVTTGKPSGSIAQLPTVSSGCHRPYAPFYLRRIRVTKADPVAQALHFLGVPCVPENGQGDDLFSPNCNTWVFTFPIATNAPLKSIDERAIDQLERYKELMVNYIEHNQSITVSCNTHEWDEVVDWLYKEDNWDNFVGISFLPRFDSESSPYPNMPYVAISKEEYDRRISKMPQYTQQQLLDLINKYEVEEEEYDLGSDCQGSCPVR